MYSAQIRFSKEALRLSEGDLSTLANLQLANANKTTILRSVTRSKRSFSYANPDVYTASSYLIITRSSSSLSIMPTFEIYSDSILTVGSDVRSTVELHRESAKLRLFAFLANEGDDHAVQVEEEHDQVEAKFNERFLCHVSADVCEPFAAHAFLCVLSFLKISVASRRC